MMIGWPPCMTITLPSCQPPTILLTTLFFGANGLFGPNGSSYSNTAVAPVWHVRRGQAGDCFSCSCSQSRHWCRRWLTPEASSIAVAV